MNRPDIPHFQTTMGVRVLLLLCLALVGLLVTSGMTVVLMRLAGAGSAATIYYSLFIQDVMVFMVPAIAAMAICYRNPLRLMGLRQAPPWQALVLVMLVILLSLPAMNWVVEWNKGLHLPAGLAGLEQELRQLEDQAGDTVQMLLGGADVGTLVLNLFIMAVMAGVSEECFFRGAMLGMLAAGRRNVHLAVWVVAIVFSAFHFQFSGFVPRMLIGAWFGYLFVRTQSLWVPIFAHAINNSLVVVAGWLAARGVLDDGQLDQLGVPQAGEMPWLALASAVATLAVIALWWHRQKPAADC